MPKGDFTISEGDFTISVSISGKDIPYKKTKTFKAKDRWLNDGESIYWNENFWADNLMGEIEIIIRKRYRETDIHNDG